MSQRVLVPSTGVAIRFPTVIPTILTIVSGACMVALAVLRVLDGLPLPQTFLQILLVLSFAGLAVVEFRAAVALVLLEIACMGASGLWTSYPAGLSGRQVLHAIVLARSIFILVAHWRVSGRLELGRYAGHAIVLAIVLPLVWMPLGLVNGNAPRDVFGDGNAHFFFAFILVFAALSATGLGPWVHRWLYIAFAANAVVTGLMILLTVTELVSLYEGLRPVVLDDFVMGGAVGYMPNGAYRLYLGSGIYLQVGAALTIWHLMRQPRNGWLWALYALFLFDITATYTRGFWLGSAVAAATVLVVGATTIRRPALIAVGTVVMFIAASGIGAVLDFSVPAYVLDRSASSLAVGGADDGFTPTTGPRREAPIRPPEGNEEGEGADVAGEFSNRVRLTQARVLMSHISERPLLGHGFGSISNDYPYGDIYSYELTYLDLAYKTGLVGLLLFLSFPLRLILDAARIRFNILKPPAAPTGVTRHEMSVVIAVVGSILVTSATNPYVLAAFGLMPILAAVAWLQPSRE